MLNKRGIYAIIGVIAVFIILHLGLAPDQHEPRTTGTTMLGGIAFLLMTSSIVLSTRLEVFEDLFGGLDRMYQVHRVVGVLAALFALVHFFGVPKELPEGVDAAVNVMGFEPGVESRRGEDTCHWRADDREEACRAGDFRPLWFGAGHSTHAMVRVFATVSSHSSAGSDAPTIPPPTCRKILCPLLNFLGNWWSRD